MIKLGIIGSPVSHSLSPWIHTFIGNALKVPVEYHRIETSLSELPARLHGLAGDGYRGINVTAPLKIHCAELVSRQGVLTPKSGSINTVRFDNERISGAVNTDLVGFDFLLGASQPRSVAVLGAGGVLTSVLSVLAQRGVPEVRVYARSRPRSHAATQHLMQHKRWMWQGLDTFSTQSSVHDAVIHCLSRDARAYSLNFDWRTLKSGCRFIDLNYGAFALDLKSCMSRVDIGYTDGLPMLVRQATESFEFWTGHTVPAPVFEQLMEHIPEIHSC